MPKLEHGTDSVPLLVLMLISFFAGCLTATKLSDLEWETLLAGAAAIAGGYMAYIAAAHPLRHRQKQKSRKLAMQLVQIHWKTFSALNGIETTSPDKFEPAVFEKLRSHTTESAKHLLKYIHALDIDIEIYSDKAERYREVAAIAISDLLKAQDNEKYLRRLLIAEKTSRELINLFAFDRLELIKTENAKGPSISA